MNNVDILVISDSLDFTTDYICLELYRRGASCLRINRDKFLEYKIVFNINALTLIIKIDSEEYLVDQNNLKSIYSRVPIYLHDIYQPNLSLEEQIYRTQWTAFLRNLTIFENVLWVNNPIDTFRAENKMLQLRYAQKNGFNCPETLVLNSVDSIDIKENFNYIMKSLDTVLLKFNDKEAFVYTNVIAGNELLSSEFTMAPVIIQEYLYPKVDLRVTVVGNKSFAVKILKDGAGVVGDWRKEKENVKFLKTDLPIDVSKKCIGIVKNLGLSFAGIDLILFNDRYYFIEANPTGEWGWLVSQSGLQIDKAICDYLQGEEVWR